MRRSKQKGSVSIILILFLLTISGVVLTQVPELFTPLNELKSKKKKNFHDESHLKVIALNLKSKWNMYKADSTCASYANHKPVVTNGLGFCLSTLGPLCAKVVSEDDRYQQCISMSSESLNWRRSYAPPSVVDVRAFQSTTYIKSFDKRHGFSNKTARITIPPTSNTNVWKKCTSAGVGCVRLALCPFDNPTCEENQTISEVVLRLGLL